MDQDLKNKTLQNITKSESILVVISKDLHLDALASGLALYLSLTKLGKKVQVLAQTPSVADAQRIYGVASIGRSESNQNPIIIVENAIETVDKVTYFLDGNRLKVVIHPLAGSAGINKDQIAIEYTDTQAQVVFALGFNNLEKLKQEITHEQLIDANSWIVNLDKSDLNQKYAQYNLVNPQASCLAEITAGMIRELALPVDEDIAYNLYAAISDSTGGFAPARTTAQTFEISAWLVKFGAGRASLAQKNGQNLHEEISSVISPSPVPVASPLFDRTPTIEELEGKQEHAQTRSGDWLKPPKIYRGSKSFDREN